MILQQSAHLHDGHDGHDNQDGHNGHNGHNGHDDYNNHDGYGNHNDHKGQNGYDVTGAMMATGSLYDYEDYDGHGAMKTKTAMTVTMTTIATTAILASRSCWLHKTSEAHKSAYFLKINVPTSQKLAHLEYTLQVGVRKSFKSMYLHPSGPPTPHGYNAILQ